MSKQTESNLFITSSLAAFYKQLLSGVTNYQELGNRILRDIKAAHAFRQVERVRELSRVLLNFPVKEYQLIAQYYLVWCKCRELKLHPEVLERIVNESHTYKTKALLSLAGFEGLKGNLDMEMYFLNEALKTSPSMPDRLQALRGIAVIKAKEGFHNSSLKDLESIVPMLRHADPLGYYDILNSYAVELGEVGQLQEAENVSSLTVTSPFSPYYSEWKETYSEVSSKRKSRSTIRVPSPAREYEAEDQADNVIRFPGTQKPSEDEILSRIDQLGGIPVTPLQLLGLILRVVLKERITDAEIDKICNVYYYTLMDKYTD